jgi:hypothetical protein
MSDEKKTSKAEGTTKAEGGMFGITQDTKSSNAVPIPAPQKLNTPNPQFPTGYSFPVSRLVSVASDPEFEKKDGNKVPILRFIFKTPEGQQYMHTEWPVESTDEKFQLKLDSFNSRVKHIWEQTIGTLPEEGIGTGAKSWTSYFAAIADSFNKQVTDDGKTKFSRTHVYTKLTYYKQNLGFPMSPNFIERVKKDNPRCVGLAINPKYDKVEPEKGGGGLPGIPGGTTPNPDSLPDFDEEYA